MPKQFLLCAAVSCALLSLLGADAQALEIPVPADERFVIELVAQEPEILTPTGIAVDAKGSVWCVENNTHFRPKNYKGFASDRIQIFSDFGPDGHARKISTFADGFQNSMNLMFGPDGAVFFAMRNEILLLRDKDGDSVCDEKISLVKLDTPGNYPHNGLSGMTLGPDGLLYFGLGENLGAAYKLIGSDGTTLSGGGEGGDIFSCKQDGKELKRHATGFWNPFGLGFDAFGRMFAVDNDPDARPPCRLMHVLRGGDYGYRFRYGRKGLHPFIAWNGEIPGTLPMISGTGEAPCAVMASESAGWPAEIRGDLLSTSWGDHLIQRFKLTCAAESATFTATPEVFVKGGMDFRPVSLARAPDGSLLVSDWAGVSYPVHGKGRIWRIRLKQPATATASSKEDGLRARITALRTNVLKEKEKRAELIEVALKDEASEVRAEAVRLLGENPGFENPGASAEKIILSMLKDPAPLVRLEALLNLHQKTSSDAVIPLLKSTDPFLFGAAVDALGRIADTKILVRPAQDKDARIRLGVLLAMRRVTDPARDLREAALSVFLQDADTSVQRAAMQWVGEEKLTSLSGDMEAAAQNRKEMPRELFEAYIATKALLSGAGKLETSEDLMAQVLADAKQPAALRALALRNLRVDHAAASVVKLKEFLSGDAALRTEAIRALAMHSHAEAQAELRTLAADKNLAPELRADVVAGLSRSAATSAETRTILLGLLAESTPALQREALRSLRGAANTPDVEQAVRAFAAKLPEGKAEERAELAEQALFALKASGAKVETLNEIAALAGTRPQNEAQWTAILGTPGDAAAGRRIFYHPRGAQCFVCHRVDGRGGNVGPELSTIGRAMVPGKVIQSILEPSREIAPQFLAWTFTLKNGSAVTGVIQDEDIHGGVTLADAQGKVVKVSAQNIERRVPQKNSLMPDALVEALTKQELRDLLAFLGSLKE